MPSLKQHKAQDIGIGLSREYPEVHELLDQFAHYPDMAFLEKHRKFLHHREGIEYIRMRWGEEASLSAKQHIIADCGHIPNASDYYDGSVDKFGGKTYGK